jgi:small subunit ribosomal protein S3
VNVNVTVARPGVAIGRGGEGIDLIKTHLSRKLQIPIDIKIHEVKKPDTSARVIARTIAEGMERRRSPKRLMVTEKEKAMSAGAKGIKIWISGDFGVPKQSRTIKIEEGEVPLQTIRAGVDFASEAAQVRNAGLHGVKVWVYCAEEEDDSDKK